MPPPGLRILLVGTGRNWSRAVRAGAEAIGLESLETVVSGREAIGRIITAERPYSHVLLQPDASDGLTDDLHGLTSGEPGSSTAFVLLGPPHRPHARMPSIARSDTRSVAATLRGRKRGTPGGQAGDMLDVLDALARSMIETRYQPIVRMGDGACVSLEALARLNHPARGMLPPMCFVQQIERAGRGGELTSAVARSALAGLAMPFVAATCLTVAVNVPLDVILDEAAMGALDVERAEAGVERDRLVFELTESRPVEDLDGLRQTVGRLRDRGYGVAIDDIGPAVPHYAALLGMPFSAVKLDGRLMRDVEGPDAAAFIDTAVAAARKHGAKVVAEGIEDAACWARAAALGIDQAQGFLIARPLPPAALPVWLETWPDRRAQLPGMLRGTPDQTSR